MNCTTDGSIGDFFLGVGSVVVIVSIGYALPSVVKFIIRNHFHNKNYDTVAEICLRDNLDDHNRSTQK